MSTAVASRPFTARFVTPLMLGSALNPINSSIIATALIAIGHEMHVGLGATASLVAVLYLASAIAQPTMGKIASRVGARRVFLCGLGIVGLGGVVGWLAPSLPWLMVARVLIGIGTSAGYPTAMALIRHRAHDSHTGIPGGVLSGIAIAGQATAALGLPIGGLLVGSVGWRSVFIVNIPLAIVGIVLTLVGVPADTPDPNARKQPLLRALDPLGIVLFAGTIIALLLFLSDLTHPAWEDIPIVVVLAAATFVWERRARNPFIDLRMLARNRPLVRTYLRVLVTMLAVYSVLYGLSQWMEEGRGLAAITVGLLLLPMNVIGALASALIGRRNWVRIPLIVVGGTILAGGVLLIFVTSAVPIWLLILLSLVFGLSNGLGSVANQTALYAQAPDDEIGVASGLLRTASYIGAIFSSSLIGLAFGARATDAGLHTIAFVFAGLGVALALLAILDRRIPTVAE